MDPRARHNQPPKPGRPGGVSSHGGNRHPAGQLATSVAGGRVVAQTTVRAANTIARAAQGPTTPEPQLPAQLSFKVNQLVRLLTNVNQAFPANTIVKITGCLPIPMSNTVREGQPNEWTQTDTDTLFKFEKRSLAPRLLTAGSKMGEEAIRHVQLAPQKGGPADMSGVQYPEGSLIYTREDIKFTLEIGGEVTVPKGTLCRIKTWITRKGGERAAKQYMTPDPNLIGRFYYRVQAQVRYWQWDTSPCKIAKEAGNFAPLTEQEIAAYKRETLPASQVVDWNESWA